MPLTRSGLVWPLLACRSCSGSSDGDSIHTERRLSDANRHTLALFAAGADAVIELEIVADHGNAMQVRGAVTDQHGALQRRAQFAVFDLVGLGALEDIFA